MAVLGLPNKSFEQSINQYSVSPSDSPTTNNTTISTEQKADRLLMITMDVSKLNSSQVEQLVSELEALLRGLNVSLALGNTSIHIVSNLLDASAETVASTSKRSAVTTRTFSSTELSVVKRYISLELTIWLN